jgi:hypothetical protein
MIGCAAKPPSWDASHWSASHTQFNVNFTPQKELGQTSGGLGKLRRMFGHPDV